MSARILELATRLADLPPASAMSNTQLVDAITLTAELTRVTEASLAAQAGVLASRSGSRDPESLAGLQGFRSPNHYVQHLVKTDHTDAARLIRLGTSLSDRVALTGDVLPASHPHLTHAFTSGALPAEMAELILTTVNTVGQHLPVDEVEAAEQLLVTRATELSLRQLRMLCTRLVAVVDPDGVEPVEEDLRKSASLTIRQLADGKTLIRALLAPEQAGIVLAAMNAKMTSRRPHFDSDAEDGTEDRRPWSVRMLDALTQIAKDSLTLDDGVVAGAPATVVVTMTLDQLQGAGGTARIDGIDQPISARTARRMAADADLIPQVLGTESEILDQGKKSRLATTAQRRALGTRDQGCIWGHCDRPPGQCEVAHLKSWASGGPTDLENLALMCRFHHRLFDTHGWQLHWDDDGTPWLIPPAHIDPYRTPRRAGPVRVHTSRR